MAKIYFPFRPNVNGGGPHIFVHKMVIELVKQGHSILYDKPNRSDVAMAIINVGKLLKQVNRQKTKVMLRIDGIYCNEYNKKFDRAIRPDMTALHNDLRVNIPQVDHVVYQSQWSFERIKDEIVKHQRDYSIIHNGCDTNMFKPLNKPDGVNLISVAKMRDDYFLETLVKTYKEVRKNHNARLLLVGNMDGSCVKVYNKYASDKNIIRVGSFSNTNLNQAYNKGHIFLDVRQGCSCNNTVAEAQAAGLPVITASWGGDKEMVIDGKTGVIVEGGHWDYNSTYVKNLSLGVDTIVKDLKGFSKRAREHAVKNLSIKVMAKKYIKAMGIEI